MKLFPIACASVLAAASLAAAPAVAAPHGGWHVKRVCHTVMRGHHRVEDCCTMRVRG